MPSSRRHSPSHGSPSSSSDGRRRRRSSPSRSPSPRRRRSASPRLRKGRNNRDRSRSPRGGDRDQPEPGKVLGIFGLNYRTSERELEKEFSRFGELDQVQLVKDPDGRSRGFAFINFVYLEDARHAKNSMCDKIFDGKQIRVDYSISDGPHPKTPGRYLGRPDRRFDRYSDRRPWARPDRSSPPPRYERWQRSPSPRRRRRSYSPRRY